MKLATILKRLNKEGFERVATQGEVERKIKSFGEDEKVTLADGDDFRVFLKDGKYILETSYSNQPITKEWLQKANTLYIIGVTYEQA